MRFRGWMHGSRAVGEEDEAEVQAAVELMARAMAPTVERLVGKARREARAGLRARQAEEQVRRGSSCIRTNRSWLFLLVGTNRMSLANMIVN